MSILMVFCGVFLQLVLPGIRNKKNMLHSVFSYIFANHSGGGNIPIILDLSLSTIYVH